MASIVIGISLLTGAWEKKDTGGTLGRLILRGSLGQGWRRVGVFFTRRLLSCELEAPVACSTTKAPS